MQKEIRFFRQNDKWYADIPNHTLEENEMISGAGLLLEIISVYRNEITLVVNTEKPVMFFMHLKKEEEDEIGATYKVVSCPFEFPWEPVWLCGVTLDVFENFPDEFYIEKVK